MIKPRVGIVDYDMGNMFSVVRACEQVDLVPVLISDKNHFNAFDALILPGVGAFGVAMENLKRLDLIDAIKKFIAGGKPFMGICLGFQLLFTESEEFGAFNGLNIFKGQVVKFPANNDKGKVRKIPHVGWSQIFVSDTGNKRRNPFLNGISNGEFMYFVHSYYVLPVSNEIIASSTSYEGIKYCSSISENNLFACQFHPEKSTTQGIQIYKNFADIINNIKENEVLK